MNRQELEHVIRAACAIAEDTELIVIGSQAVLGQFPDAPAELLTSMEADVYPKNKPERADLIEGSIGELSMFHETFGYYADGVDEGTATLPAGWKDRLVAVRGPGTGGYTGWALEIHDLIVSKYVANRDKDRRFCRVALAHGLADASVVRRRLGETPVTDAVRQRVAYALDADSKPVP
jgi:hypothetical protein